MNALKKIFFMCFVLLVNHTSGQSRIDKFREKVTQLCYANKFDVAQEEVLKFIKIPDLNPEEIFYGHFMYADILKSTNKTDAAILALLDCKKYSRDLVNPKLHESLIYGNIAECFFNTSDYKNANKYAALSINSSPDSSLRGNGHAVNYLILGYGFYVEKQYEKAIENYIQVMGIYKSKGSTCELPLVYMKIAKVYNAMGDENRAELNINRAVSLSDSCGIENYKLLSKRTLFDIYKDNKNYEKALAQLEEINVLVEKLEFAKQAQSLSEMEARYKNILSQQEIKNLKNLNAKNKNVITKQQETLLLAIFISAILLILVSFIIYIARQRKKAKIQLEIMNLDLEKKVRERTKELADDIVVRKRLEIKLSEKVREMEVLIAKLSHDMRSPLASIMGLVELAEKDKAKDAKTYLEKIKIAIKRLDEIIIDLTNIVYISNMDIKPETVNFENMIEEILFIMQFREKFEKIKFEVKYHHLRQFHSDPKFVQSILQNLIENAIKYSANVADPSVEILINDHDLGILITVADNGIGIAPELHSKIFDMFYRGTEISKGTGLGLYILKKAVDNLKGKIQLESQKGTGTTFKIYIPSMEL